MYSATPEPTNPNPEWTPPSEEEIKRLREEQNSWSFGRKVRRSIRKNGTTSGNVMEPAQA